MEAFERYCAIGAAAIGGEKGYSASRGNFSVAEIGVRPVKERTTKKKPPQAELKSIKRRINLKN